MLKEGQKKPTHLEIIIMRLQLFLSMIRKPTVSCSLQLLNSSKSTFSSYFYGSWSIRHFRWVTSWDCRESNLTFCYSTEPWHSNKHSILSSIASGTKKAFPGEMSTSPKASPPPSWMPALEMCGNNKPAKPQLYILIRKYWYWLWQYWFFLLKAKKLDAAEDQILNCTV